MFLYLLNERFRFPLLYTVVSEKWAEHEIATLAGEKLKHLFVFGFRKEVEWEYEIEKIQGVNMYWKGLKLKFLIFLDGFEKRHLLK